jgi:phosphoribosylamine-glycine ligase
MDIEVRVIQYHCRCKDPSPTIQKVVQFVSTLQMLLEFILTNKTNHFEMNTSSITITSYR